MPNLLAHALAAIAAHVILGYVFQGTVLTEYAFVSALLALLPDLDLHGEDRKSPYGHSIGYGLLYLLLCASGLSIAVALGVLQPGTTFPLLAATVVGLGTHLMLDALEDPGIFTFPRRGRWGRISYRVGKVRNGHLDFWISSLSASLILILLTLS